MGNSKKILLSGNQKPYLERNDSLNILYGEVRPYKPLSQEETKQLFEIYHNGSEKESRVAFEKICRHNIKIVISLARDYCSSEDNLNDLIQEGNIGLMKAVELFDVNNGTPFHGYAMYWIRRYINIFKTNVTPIVQQTNRSKTASVITTITSDLWQKHERVPMPEEILEEYNLRYSKKPIQDTDDLVNVEYVYIDAIEPTYGQGQGLQDYIDFNGKSFSHNNYLDDIENEQKKIVVNELLEGLTPNESKAIQMLYGLNDTMESSMGVIAMKMGISPQRVSQLCAAAIKKMKKKSVKYATSLR